MIVGPITVVVSPPRLVIRVGQDITIQCSATGGANREYVVQWSFQGRVSVTAQQRGLGLMGRGSEIRH